MPFEGGGHFLYGQFIFKPPLPSKDLTGQTIIVTGSNVGLGFESAKHFARLNAEKVILACRNAEKGEAARQRILAATNHRNRPESVEVWPLDLGSYESVVKFGEMVKGLERLDAVLENAGISTPNYQVVEDNEATITVNVVSALLVALLVLPKLQQSAAKFGIKPRLTMVSSAVHYWVKFSEKESIERGTPILEALNDKQTANMADRYYLSKLLVLLVWRELVAQIGPTAVIANVVEPGLCWSELFRDDPRVNAGLGKILLKAIARTTDQGSRVLVNATLSGEETHGKYMANCRVIAPSSYVRSQEGQKMQKALWKELTTKLETIKPGIMGNLINQK